MNIHTIFLKMKFVPLQLSNVFGKDEIPTGSQGAAASTGAAAGISLSGVVLEVR
jgi:hypothetical protein